MQAEGLKKLSTACTVDRAIAILSIRLSKLCVQGAYSYPSMWTFNSLQPKHTPNSGLGPLLLKFADRVSQRGVMRPDLTSQY